MAHTNEQPVESPAGAVFSRSQPDAPEPPQDQPPEEPQVVKSATGRVWDLVGRNMTVALGPTRPRRSSASWRSLPPCSCSGCRRRKR
jgi:hypothetical protein